LGDDEFRCETSLGNLIWSFNKNKGSCLGSDCVTAADSISFWRPDPPPEYVSLGDVAFVGDYPDNQTVITYRYDDDRFERPLDFDLVWRNWRDGSGSPISIWMPKAPNGYVSLGCVVCADFEKPDLDVVWCVHSDMTEETTLEDNPIWKAPSEAPWHCFVYPVISEVKTFVALREEKSENTPKPRKVIL
jgi:vacuolar protein sorting-associated protein 13A/C